MNFLFELRKHTFSSVLFFVVILVLCTASTAKAQSSEQPISWGDALEQEPAWYESSEASRIADNVLLYQHISGGWPKNIDMARVLSKEDKDDVRSKQAEGESSLSETTMDNGATYTQMRYLALVFKSSGYDRFKESFLRGLDYLLEAQYDNGGWPQYYPLRDGYYEDITFNDGAMIRVMRLLRNVARGNDRYSFVDEGRRKQAVAAIEKGLEVILKTQIEVDGKLTAWCAQYHPETLQPVDARSYELVSLSGAESVGIVDYLMELNEPGPEVITAVESAVEWFDKVKLEDIRVIQLEKPSLPKGYDRVIGFDPTGATPLWARFYEIGTNYPMFVDRESIVHYAFSELPYERRVGYSWTGDWPLEMLEEKYPEWKNRIDYEKQ